jgi:hypothetical protein
VSAVAVSEYERHQVFHWFEEAMGPERAATMMNLLPPVSWAEIASKDDLMAHETRLRGEIAELRGEIAELRGDIKVGNAELLRTLMLGMVASNAALVGLVFAAVRLG